MPDDNFFTHLRLRKTFHIFISAETDDFDPSITRDWRNEGFSVTYVPFGNGGADYVRKIQGLADRQVGVSEQYAIICVYISLVSSYPIFTSFLSPTTAVLPDPSYCSAFLTTQQSPPS